MNRIKVIILTMMLALGTVLYLAAQTTNKVEAGKGKSCTDCCCCNKAEKAVKSMESCCMKHEKK